jgi:hypothetical protein
VSVSHRPTSTSTPPPSRAERARFIRRQEAFTIGWLRALSRSASASSTAARPAPTPSRRTAPDEPA